MGKSANWRRDGSPRSLQQPAHRIHRSPGVALELRVVLVQHRQVGIEREGPLKRALGLDGTAAPAHLSPYGGLWTGFASELLVQRISLRGVEQENALLDPPVVTWLSAGPGPFGLG